ncbi:helical backbone metal receptor [Nocardioides bruguierae]|uniref:Helical backbone metal receptor n=1 Tax=Nocardioides bruguierae TaxID=2945102 RepID=A0A9X2D8Z5_9ACTN|nr:helical backbone metal receptor [Nocardioides bruguierae]MCM0621498.1 helical backbone metal receptor [Nocardioides bruguierae]
MSSPARRVVSLVPSLTEALATTRPEALVGVTDWCTHPPDLDARGVARVRGTKNPDLAAVLALEPDVVVANKEENREIDVRRLREAGVRVVVTEIETVPQAVAEMRRLLVDELGWTGGAGAGPAWLDAVADAWLGPLPPVTREVVVPVWRDPWMVVGAATFTADLCRRLGWRVRHPEPAARSALARTGEDRYPRVESSWMDAAGADAVLLMDEPYVFTEDDGPEVFTRTPVEMVSGRLLTWYGPSLLRTRESVAREA